MGGFFNLDGPFYKWGTEVADIMILSLLWLVCCLPVVTIGASTTALFYVLGKKVRKEDPYIVKNFFYSFKQNFKQATILTFIVGVMAISGYLYFEILLSGSAQIWVKIIGMFFIIQATFISLYIFPVLSRFDMPIKNILISSFVFANKHFVTSILCTILFVVSIYIVLTLNPLSIFSFGLYALLSSFLFQKIFTKNINAVQAAQEKQANGEGQDEDESEEIIENEAEIKAVEFPKEMKNE